jgi:hypothetical protein
MQRLTRLEVADRRKTIADLLLQGWTQKAIAAHVRVAPSTVTRDVQEIERQWRESTIRDFDAIREHDVRKLDLVETEAWAGWRRSQAPLQAASMTEGAAGENRRTSSLKHQYGNPRFLEQVVRCIAERGLLLGLHPTIVPQEEPIHERVSLEVRRERVLGLLSQLGERERAGQPGTGPDDGQPGGAGDRDQPRSVADGAAPDVARPGAAGGH